jgi:hypothetical protein
MKPPPLTAQLEDGQLQEPRERLCDIDRRLVHVSARAAFRSDSGECRRWASMMSKKNRASFSPCPPGSPARCAAASPSPASSLRCWPHRWLSRVSTRSCLVNRSTFGSSAFTGVLAAATRSAFDSTDRSGFLVLAAGDGTLRRDGACDLALPFLGAALLGLRDFARERDDMGLGSVGSRRRN